MMVAESDGTLAMSCCASWRPHTVMVTARLTRPGIAVELRKEMGRMDFSVSQLANPTAMTIYATIYTLPGPFSPSRNY